MGTGLAGMLGSPDCNSRQQLSHFWHRAPGATRVSGFSGGVFPCLGGGADLRGGIDHVVRRAPRDLAHLEERFVGTA